MRCRVADDIVDRLENNEVGGICYDWWELVDLDVGAELRSVRTGKAV
jgi:hypothetical protein